LDDIVKQSFGIKLPGLVPQYAPTLRDLPDLVVEFERMGYDDVCDGEHILFGPVMRHPGGSGRIVHGRREKESDRADTIVMFSAIASRTTSIKLYSCVILAAAHQFAVLARQAATLDVVSNGRFVLGVGQGWFTKEFEAMGIPPRERDERLEETIRACQALWSPGLSEFEGKWIHFHDVLSEPATVTPGGVPVWWGGNALDGPTAHRVATLGQGWIAREAASYDELAKSIDRIVSACTEVGRDPSSVGFRATLVLPTTRTEGSTPEELFKEATSTAERLAGLGITHFTVPVNDYQLSMESLQELRTVLREA
jgi:probable F420-dependent oxidoreductase